MFESLSQQLNAAAAAFAADAGAFQRLLAQMAADVERMEAEPLDMFPVAHHSPASALHMVRRLHEKPPRVIYIEMCEDMLGLVEHLRDCRLPVAFQAFASTSDFMPLEALPAMVVAPLTEASAEYQAIAYALTHPETQLVFVDRAVDFVFQWQGVPETDTDEEEEAQEAVQMHGHSVGVTVGVLEPTFDEFLYYLLQNSHTRHFSEWWAQYVERAILHANYATYRQVMTLVGSLMRHLGQREEDIISDRLRERYMWTRMKEHMTAHNIAPHDALYICGAAHLASDVEEFGTLTPAVWVELPPRSQTEWLFGLIPSSFTAIEGQFGQPSGTVKLAEATWGKSLKAANLKAFEAYKEAQKGKRGAVKPPVTPGHPALLTDFLTVAPEAAETDQEQLLGWCSRIVALARENGYLASTADAIAIYETAYLLAHMRHRLHPSPYDFQDAAITCLEKDRTPKKRNITQLCHLVLGGDRIGTVGYSSLPPLAQNIYDRLAPLGINLFATTNQRALMDFTQRPDLLDCSELLWRLNYLLGDGVVEPIIGERKLGGKPIQESWEVRIGKHQRAVIQLGYEGVTLEQVLEGRMRQRAFADDATANSVLHTTEASLMYLNNPRFTDALGYHSRALLLQEVGVADAPAIFDRARRLVHYYRATPQGIAPWLATFVASGYSHYASLLPRGLSDQGTTPEAVSGTLGFIFSMESLALSLGCQRAQVLISIQQAGREAERGVIPPDKIGLLWVAEWLLNLRTIQEMRDFFTQLMSDSYRLQSLPLYLNGFILAIEFAPRIALFVVELFSHVFRHLPDTVLIPWLPTLILQLRRNAKLLQPIIKQAGMTFPNSLKELESWQPRWMDNLPRATSLTTMSELNPTEKAVQALLASYPASVTALAGLLGIEALDWNTHPYTFGSLSPEEAAIQVLLASYPESTNRLATYFA